MRALDLAKYIVKKCINDRNPISNSQLQYILYCVQMDFQRRKKFAFYDDFEERNMGFIVPNVYYWYSGFGVEPIRFDDSEIDESSIPDKYIIDKIVEQKRTIHPIFIREEEQKMSKSNNHKGIFFLDRNRKYEIGK